MSTPDDPVRFLSDKLAKQEALHAKQTVQHDHALHQVHARLIDVQRKLDQSKQQATERQAKYSSETQQLNAANEQIAHLQRGAKQLENQLKAAKDDERARTDEIDRLSSALERKAHFIAELEAEIATEREAACSSKEAMREMSLTMRDKEGAWVDSSVQAATQLAQIEQLRKRLEQSDKSFEKATAELSAVRRAKITVGSNILTIFLCFYSLMPNFISSHFEPSHA